MFEEEQEATARWMGYGSREEMNAEHDPLHIAMCAWLGFHSYAMQMARGERLTKDERVLADLEENAVLHLQRFIQHARRRK